MENYYRQTTGHYFSIDIYGNGPEEEEIQRAFHGRNFETNPITSLVESKTCDAVNETKEFQGVDSDNNDEISNFSTRLGKVTSSIEVDLPKSLHEWRKTPIPAAFHGRVDHASLGRYKVFINPSLLRSQSFPL